MLQNALVHIDLLHPAAVRLLVFENRIEIINPGRLYGGPKCGERITGGHYLDAVLALYCDDLVTDDEISRFSEKVVEFLKRYKESL